MPGGSKSIKEFIAKNLKYPPEALANRIEGSVTLRLTINHKGHVTEAHVISHLGHGCDEEAVRVASMLIFEVEPPRGLRVVYHKKLTIHFKLPVAKTLPATQDVQPVSGIQYTYNAPPETAEESPDSKTANKSYHYSITIGRQKS